MTPNQIQFFSELSELLIKYDASIAASDCDDKYECWPDGINFEFPDGTTKIGNRTMSYDGYDITQVVNKLK